MISLRKVEKSVTIKNNGNEIATIDLQPSSITNKIEIVLEFIEDVSKLLGSEFDDWFSNFITNYRDSDPSLRFEIVSNEVPNIIKFCDKYIELKDIKFSQFVNRSKSKKTSIIFDEDEILQLTKLSSYLKIYSIIFNTNLRLNEKQHRVIFNNIIKNNSNLISKVFELVRMKTYTYNYTDRFMWIYIDIIQGKELESHIMEIFNFIMNEILVLCKVDKNPITFFVTVIETSVYWLLRGIYKTTLVFHEENISNIQTIAFDVLRGCISNDIIKRLWKTGLKYCHGLIEDNNPYGSPDKDLIEFQKRISKIESIAPAWKFILFPILSRSLGICYNDLLNLDPENTAPIAVYCSSLLRSIFKGGFDSLFDILRYYTDSSIIMTTYKIKDITSFVNEVRNMGFLGMKTVLYPYKLISYFTGVITKSKYRDILTGDIILPTRSSEVEHDCIEFFIRFFSGNLDEHLKLFKSKLLTFI